MKLTTKSLKKDDQSEEIVSATHSIKPYFSFYGNLKKVPKLETV